MKAFFEDRPPIDARVELDKAIEEGRVDDLEFRTAIAIEDINKQAIDAEIDGVSLDFEPRRLAMELAQRSLALAPDDARLILIVQSLRANDDVFEPERLVALIERTESISMRRRLHANLGVAYFATNRVRDGLSAFASAAENAHEPMRGDPCVHGDLQRSWPQRMREVLRMDALGEHVTKAWGIGAYRMLVLLEGLATVVSDEDAKLLRTHVSERLERGRRGPEAEDFLEGAADYARFVGLDLLALRDRHHRE